VHPTVPPQVEYALTDLGRTLIEPVDALARWAIENRDVIEAAQKSYDGRPK
ncbi:MAG: transcriptional regulator, partial [Myxococcales bacterium]